MDIRNQYCNLGSKGILTTYTQYKITNPSPQALDILSKLDKKYSFSSEFNSDYRIFTITTIDQSLITLIDSKNVPSIVKSTIDISEYDDTKTIDDVKALIQSNGDLSNIRPELISQAQSKISPKGV